MLTAHDWRKIQALQDFKLGLSAITFFSEIAEETTRVERRRFRCFHDAAVVAYCRPFTKSSGLPLLSLKDIGITPTLQEKTLHNRLVTYRNKVVAHTDTDRMRLLLTSFTIKDIAMPQITDDEGFEFLDDILPLEIWFHQLIHALASYVFDKVQEFPHGIRLLKDYLEDSASA